MMIYRGITGPYDPGASRRRGGLVWWTPSRERALVYTLLSARLPVGLELRSEVSGSHAYLEDDGWCQRAP